MTVRARPVVVAIQPRHMVPNSDGYIPVDNPYELCLYMQGQIRNSGMKHAKIARAAKLCPQTVSRLADHTTKDPRINTCMKILGVIGKRVYVK